jgi:ADP-ribose pyrophosphatase YjhB (NUDIX family)
MAAGVLLFDAAGRVLLVNPTYKDYWDVPGGVVELNESPRDAARRELGEELGLDREPGALLCVDWVAPRADRSEGLITIFDGGTLGPEEIARIQVAPGEVASCEFVDVATARTLLSPLLGRRVVACLSARAERRSVYLENGVPTCARPGG